MPYCPRCGGTHQIVPCGDHSEDEIDRLHVRIAEMEGIIAGREELIHGLEYAVDEITAKRDGLRVALNDAMTSLEWIAGRSRGKNEADLEIRMEMKGYAGSRARAAREALVK